jgi:RNA polymerase subunit RPABC4/transcription elongation factor Spt4
MNMHYTCKRCCTIMDREKACPVCGKDDEVSEIVINVYAHVKAIRTSENQK